MQRLIDDPMGTARKHMTALTEELERSRPLHRIREVLAELHRDRDAHFREEEEAGGLFDELRSLRPGLDGQVEALERQHPELLAALDELRRRFDDLGERIRQAQRDVGSLMDTMEAHERAEAELIVTIHYEDVGVGD